MPGCNGLDRGSDAPARKRADFLRVSPHERTWQTDQGGRADDGSDNCGCGPPHRDGLAQH